VPDNPDRMAPAPSSTEAFVSALSVRVSDLGEGLRSIRSEVRESHSSLSSEIRGLSASMAERNKTPWATLVSFAAFLVAFGGIAVNTTIAPLNQNMARLEAQQAVDRGQQASDKKDVSSDLKEYMRASFAEMKEMRNSIVSRGEHEQRWLNAATQQSNIQRQLDEIRQSYGNTFSIRDGLMDLGKRIERLEHTPARQ
jgi:hypothetical protein